MRLQDLYSAATFPPRTILLTGLAFRPDGFSGVSPKWVVRTTIRLAVTSRNPGELSPRFEENLNPSARVVFSGERSFDMASLGVLPPTAFSIWFPFSEPFAYDPAQGNLLVEFRTEFSTGGQWTDASNKENDGASRVFAYDPGAQTAGFVDTGADILAFSFEEVAPPSVVPPGFSAKEDDGYAGTLSVPMRVQEVYAAEHFSTSPVQINQIRFRRDGSVPPFEHGEVSLRVLMAATPTPPGALSQTFADNLGTDYVECFDGTLSFSSVGEANPPPAAFDLAIPLSTPFVYDPSLGNLLLDVQVTASQGVGMVDSSNDVDDGASRVFSFDPSSPTAAYSDTGADIIQLDYEPVRPQLLICPPGGSIDGPTPVVLRSSVPGAVIRFTLDGTIPTSASQAFTGILPVNRSAILTAALFVDGQMVSEPITATYLNPAEPITLLPEVMVEDKMVTLSVDGWEGFELEVESTTSYHKWTSLGAVTVRNGRVAFQDPLADMMVARFYRLVLPLSE